MFFFCSFVHKVLSFKQNIIYEIINQNLCVCCELKWFSLHCTKLQLKVIAKMFIQVSKACASTKGRYGGGCDELVTMKW